MELKELYSVYGQLMIELEILNNKINEVKRQIVEELNKKPVEENKNESVNKASNT